MLALYVMILLCEIIMFRLVVLLDGSALRNWYLVELKLNSHRLAEQNLHRQGFENFLPMNEVIKRKGFRFINSL